MPQKRQKRQTLWKKIRFKYKLSFLNENTLEEVFSLRLSGLYATLIIAFFCFLLISLTAILIINTPIRNYLPGYLDSEIRHEIISQELKVDSLEKAIGSKDVFLTNLSSILRGDIPADSIHVLDSAREVINVDTANLGKNKASESFVKKYEEEAKYNLSSLSASSDYEHFSFYRPVKGIVSSRFNQQEKHFGIDIAADPKQSILATLDGTVIYTGYDAKAGYVIQLQHNNSYISIYKHNAILLKKQGDKVKAGEAIALVGNTGSLSTGPHLHFELWLKGQPINPEEYIIFK